MMSREVKSHSDFRGEPLPPGKRAVASTLPSPSGDRAHPIPKSATQAAAAMREDSSKAKRCLGDAYLPHGGEAEEKHSALEPMPQTSVVGVTAGRDRHLISRKLISEASRVLDADELEEFESVIRGVRG